MDEKIKSLSWIEKTGESTLESFSLIINKSLITKNDEGTKKINIKYKFDDEKTWYQYEITIDIKFDEKIEKVEVNKSLNKSLQNKISQWMSMMRGNKSGLTKEEGEEEEKEEKY